MAFTAIKFKFILHQNLKPAHFQNYSFICVRKFSSNENEGRDDQKEDVKKDKGESATSPSKTLKSVESKPKLVIDEVKQAAAKAKLLSLLSDVKIVPSASSALKLARPLQRPSKKDRFKDFYAEKRTPVEKLDQALKAVASSFPKDSEKVETELKEKLSSLQLSKEIHENEKVKTLDQEVDEEMKENIMNSVHEVASTVADTPIEPKSELTRRLLRLSLDTKMKKRSPLDFSGLKIESQHKEVKQRTRTMKAEKTKTGFVPERKMPVTMDLFGALPLNIFSLDTEKKQGEKNEVWQRLQEKELKLLTQYAPKNAFEEMIMWTEQGKHWKFPIDNEAEIGSEEKVGFNEHVFLEQHLKGFPTQGPIRHFIELVCVGLSKNPYITVERKIENINWFRNYFMEKEEILKSCGAIDPKHSFNVQIP